MDQGSLILVYYQSLAISAMLIYTSPSFSSSVQFDQINPVCRTRVLFTVMHVHYVYTEAVGDSPVPQLKCPHH